MSQRVFGSFPYLFYQFKSLSEKWFTSFWRIIKGDRGIIRVDHR